MCWERTGCWACWVQRALNSPTRPASFWRKSRAPWLLVSVIVLAFKNQFVCWICHDYNYFLHLLVENKPKKELIRMLQQMGYDSDPVKAWKLAQEKVMFQWVVLSNSYLPEQMLHIYISTFRTRRRQLTRRMKQRRRRQMGLITTTCWACPCGSWPKRRKRNYANRGMLRCALFSFLKY